MFDEPEKAALAYCEGLTVDNLPGFVPLTAHFDGKQIAAIVINMNLWTRLKLALGACSGSGWLILAEQAGTQSR